MGSNNVTAPTPLLRQRSAIEPTDAGQAARRRHAGRYP